MRWLFVFAALFAVTAMVCLAPLPLAAQDAAVADAKHHKVEFENDQVRVLRYVIAPHEATEPHEHPAGVQIMLTDTNAKVTTPDGKTTEAHGKAGTAVLRPPLKHVVENIGDQPIEGILVEPKGKAGAGLPAGAQDVVTVDPTHSKVEAENDQVRVVRYHYGPGEKSPTHGHPDNVQIALTDSNARITSAQGPTEQHARAGQVVWRRATQHSVENIGDKPFEGVLIELKGGKAGAAAK